MLLVFIAAAQAGPYESVLVELETIPSEPRPAPLPEILTQLSDLSDLRLIGYRNNTGEVGTSLAMVESGGAWRPNMLIRADLTHDGYGLLRLMELDRLPRADLDAIVTGLGGRLREI